jgi:hypothetical protein
MKRPTPMGFEGGDWKRVEEKNRAFLGAGVAGRRQSGTGGRSDRQPTVARLRRPLKKGMGKEERERWGKRRPWSDRTHRFDQSFERLPERSWAGPYQHRADHTDRSNQENYHKQCKAQRVNTWLARMGHQQWQERSQREKAHLFYI